MKFRHIVFITLLLLLIVTPAATTAQDMTESHPLHEMLALVPDTEAGRSGILMYADLRAAEEGRNWPPVTSRAMWDGMETLGNESVWLWTIPSTIQPDLRNNLMIALDDMPRLLGFGVFDIDRTLTFNNPPSTGNIIQGRFDPAAIDAALTARDYTQEADGDLTLWCGMTGCEGGLDMNFEAREPGNPFGGSFGRQEPFAITDSLVLNSPDFETLTQLIDTYQQEQPSLLDAPAYHAAADAITQAGVLRAAMFVSPVEVFGEDPLESLTFATDGSEEQIAALATELGLDDPSFGTVGLAAELVVLADRAVTEEGRQSAVIALVYVNAKTAQTARDELEQRLSEPITLLATQDRTMNDVIDTRGGILQAPRLVETAVDGRVVLLLELDGDLVQGAGIDEDGRIIPSGQLFDLWQRMLFQRDFLWLN